MTTLETTDDLLRAARENAEFREAFRREVLTEELLSMPQRMGEYMRESDAKGDALTGNVNALTEDVAALTKNVAELAERVTTLTEDVASLTANLAALTEQVNAFMQAANERFDGIDRRFDRVDSQLNRMDNDLATLKGVGLESKLYNRGVALMATHLRMREGRIVRVAESDDNSREFNGVILAALNGGGITQAQYDRILDTDMVIAGTEIESGSPIYAVIEASYSLSGDDISKVCATATLVRRLFPEAVVKPVLYYMTPNARLEGEAADQGVTLVSTPAIR